MANSYDVLREAILTRSSVSATYDGHYREMTPHTLGSKHGSPHALLYQFGGTSSSGLGPPGAARNWRCVFVSKLSEVRLIPGEFHTAPNHSRPQTCVDVIDVEAYF
jgi:hypothetical protein